MYRRVLRQNVRDEGRRGRRIIEELRKRFGDMGRPQEELDYIERMLKDY